MNNELNNRESKLMQPEKAVAIIDKNIGRLREKFFKQNKNKQIHKIAGEIVAIFHEFMWDNLLVEHGTITIDEHLSLHFLGNLSLFYKNEYVTEWHWSKSVHVKKSSKYWHLQKEYNS